jgi:hypothetical protein
MCGAAGGAGGATPGGQPGQGVGSQDPFTAYLLSLFNGGQGQKPPPIQSDSIKYSGGAV